MHEVHENLLLFAEADEPPALRRVAQRVERDLDELVAHRGIVVVGRRACAVAHQPVTVRVGEQRDQQLELLARERRARRG